MQTPTHSPDTPDATPPARAARRTWLVTGVSSGLGRELAVQAAAIIASVEVEPAPLRMVLGSQALDGTLAVLRARIAGFEAQRELAASTDVPPGG